MNWMLMPLKRYADFSGRSRRKEYWMFTLGLIILYALFIMIIIAGAGQDSAGLSLLSGGAGLLFLAMVIGLIIPTLAVQVRRFHDQDKSGWFILLNFVPFIGGIIVLVMYCIEGTKGPNRFGPDPKGEDHAATFS